MYLIVASLYYQLRTLGLAVVIFLVQFSYALVIKLYYRLLVHRDLDDSTIQELFMTYLIKGCI